jgi:two-component system chemotaxis response regulator CheY
MPEMSGIELLGAIAQEGFTVPFGFVTSEGTAEMRCRASQAGARFLLAKPFSPEMLSQALAPILSAE